MTEPTPVGAVHWDWDALAAGALVALVVAMPFAVLGRIALSEGWSDAVVVVCNLGMIGGLFLGAGTAAWRQHVGTPLSHGIVIALSTYILLQAVIVAVRLLRGSDVNFAAIAFNAVFALGAGLLGGFCGQLLLGRGIVPPDGPSSRP
jgi:hypothetical protein